MQLFNNRYHFVDSHCHFDFPVFAADRAAVWAHCQRLGVNHLIIPGVSPEQWQTAAQLCQQYPGFYYAAGIHPHWIEQQHWCATNSVGLLDEITQQQIKQLLGDEFTRRQRGAGERCIAVGECGLDKLIQVPLALQQQLLGLHIELANQFHKPLIIHSVKTHNEILTCFKQQPPRYGGVIHAFSGSLEMAQQFIAHGFLLGVGGTITYERAQKTRATFSKIPLQYLLLETDAPDMPVCGKQGERNSPEYLPVIAQTLAQLQGVSVEQVAEVTTRNAHRLFGLPE